MKAVEGYTKAEYKKECEANGGETFEFDSLKEAAEQLADMLGYSVEVAEEGILNGTNCGWILFEDGTVLFRYYGKNLDKTHIEMLRNRA